ncbi:HK97-gp10 family putative phage morphogenesis protein [Ponticoccus alexandrii]|nr:HK97-gp10 family putative phage morphogenesis protein [Ponticoccus alexandrii]
MKFEGGDDLEKALMDLPHTTAKASARRMLKKGGQIIAEAGAANAPEREGDLKASYVVGTRLTKSQRRATRGAAKDDVQVFVGPGPRGYEAGEQTEFGNQHQAAEPHLRPAFNSKAQDVLNLIAQEWWADIAKAVARRARKLAKGR